MKYISMKGLSMMALSIVIIAGCGKDINPQQNKKQDFSTYIQTKNKNIGAPLYRNRTRGAVHMMRASNGYYYSYDGDAGNWPIQKSKDGITWKRLGKGGEGYPEGTWGKRNFWVPEVIEMDGRFYMFYCAREDYDTPSSRIGIAISDSPEGPFKDTGKQLFEGTEMENWHVIDPNPFIDPDTGKKYMFFVKDGAIYWYRNDDLNKKIRESHIYGVELSDDMLSVKGDPELLIRPTQDWEYKSHTLGGRKLWVEAPVMLKKKDTYYLMYSANFFRSEHYAVGYATSKDPLGTYVKDELNPVISSVATNKKAGHSSIISSPDGSEFFTSYTVIKAGRYMSRIGFRDNGTLYVNGPVGGYQVMPSGTTDYKNYAEQAEVTASSTKPSYSLDAVHDGETGVYERYERYEWRSYDEKEGAWVQLQWKRKQKVEYILIYGSAVDERQIKAGHIILNEDKEEKITNISFPGDYRDPVVIRFPEGKNIRSIKFVVDSLKESHGSAGLSEMVVLGKK